MKIALPLSATDEFAGHYGQARKFEVFNVDQAQQRVSRRLIVVPQASRPCQWPRLLRAAGVDLMLVGNIGAGARRQMADEQVRLLAGVPSADPDAIVAAWLAGTLTSGHNACDHADGHSPAAEAHAHATPGDCRH